MSKNTNNTDRQGYYNHLEAMKNHEKDVDAFLEANRLERHESTRKASVKRIFRDCLLNR